MSATIARRCRRWSAPRSTICATSPAKRLEADEEAETRIVETLMRVAQELKKM